MFAALVFLLCAVTSGVCMVLLGQAFRRTRSRLLLWSAWCFVCLALNNTLVFVDLVILPAEIDLQIPRLIASFAGTAVLLFGFIWDVEQ